ncbi:MAG: trypsin-like peptidase domain-containing protein [Proteobacteria bacterium]|nr:trypsin-like peptidase domain-containing protein [Pseudomonadota bacterium]
MFRPSARTSVWLALPLCGLLLTAPPTLAATPSPSPAPAPTDTSPGAPSQAVENAVVKVFSTMLRPDLARPWAKQAPTEVSGSGVVIEGHRILTNAHVVSYASQVQIQANQAGDKLSATVEAVAPGIDLAVLKLDDPAFFRTHAPLPRATALPHIKDAVLAYGFPTGGASLSITKGIVSRIEFVPYNYGTSGVRVQIDAPINPGNSGGPAVVGERMIGLTFSHLRNAENIGYIIPNEEIELFLKAVADGHLDGKPALYLDLQTLENPALRDYLKLPAGSSGVVVGHVLDERQAVLHPLDVITQIGDHAVDDQGMVRVDADLRLFFTYEAQKVAHNGVVPLTVIRGGKVIKVDVPVVAHRAQLVPSLEGQYPSYFIYGPLVFTRATQEFLGLIGAHQNLLYGMLFGGSPLLTRLGDAPQPERSELVLIPSPLFPHSLSKGYSDPAGMVVRTVNGTPIRSLAHLVEVLRNLKDEFVTFEFDGRLGESLVFRRAAALAATEDILNDNGVRAQGSPDMIKIWQGR